MRKKGEMITLAVAVIIFFVSISAIVIHASTKNKRDELYDQAIIRLDGDVYYEVDVQSIRRVLSFEDIEITGTNGTVYRTHLNNVILLGGGEEK